VQIPSHFAMKFNILIVTACLFLFSCTNAVAQCVAPTNISIKTISPTAISVTAINNDGTIELAGFQIGQRFQVCEGSLFLAATALNTIQDIPTDGIIKSDISNPTVAPQTYTVRVYDELSDVCYTDLSTIMHPTVVIGIDANETFTLKAPDTLAAVQWLRNGQPIAGATDPIYIATSAGRYTFVGTTLGGCTIPSCSPLHLAARNTLPVTLLYFTAIAKDCNVTLNWATATEKNNKTFEIWRSTDGLTYTKLGEVRGAGNSSAMRSYTFADAKPQRTNYYKLVQIDYDGTATNYALAQSVKMTNCFDETTNGISSLYPNPNGTDHVTVKFYTERDPETVSFEWYDVTAKLVRTEAADLGKGTNIIDLDIDNLAAGVYILRARGNGWYSLPQRMVKIGN
jgi:hypothetical protein